MNTRRFWITAVVLLFVGGCHQPKDKPPEPGNKHSAGPLPPKPKMTFELSTAGLPEVLNWKCDPVLADVNKDGFIDLAAIPRLGRGPHFWLGDGNGAWTESSGALPYGFGDRPNISSCGGGVKFADANEDGHLDMLVADHCHGVFAYLGDGEGQWEMVTQGLHPTELVKGGNLGGNLQFFIGAEDLDVGDFNGDGHLDLLASSSDDGGINMYLGDGTGKNWKRLRSDLPATGWANRVAFADINADNLPDVVASYCDGPRVWLNDGEGGLTPSFTGFPTPLTGGLYCGLAVADINKDGRLDIATANWSDGPEVYLQNEDGSWLKSPDVFPRMLGGAFGIAVGDLDQDGHLDIVVSGRLPRAVGYVYGVSVLRGDGGSTWTEVAGCGLPETGLSFTWGIALADVDRDNILDIVAGSGGIVATAPGMTEPVIPARMLVWLTRLPD